MEQILMNLALMDTIQFCKQHGIDCSGSHIVKADRGYTYTLVRTETGKPIVSVAFSKSSVPTHVIYGESATVAA